MALKIELDHPTFLLKPKVHEACKGFMDDFGFSYFQYLRCFSDGSIGLLTNHTGLMEHFQHVDNSPVVFSSFEEENEQAHSYWFLWDEALPEMPVQLAREKFNIHNGITFVRRSKHYYDMIAVGLPYEQNNQGSFYLNKFKAIEQFIHKFDLEHKELLNLMNTNPIVLPETYRDLNYKKICLNKDRIKVLGKSGETYITGQELACLRELLQGASHKQIAQTLGISPRSVETYLLRIKGRTGFTSWPEIERMMYLFASL